MTLYLLLVAEAAKPVVVMVVAALLAAAVVFFSDESEDEVAAASEPESEAEVVGSESTTMPFSMLAILLMEGKRYRSSWINGESRQPTLDQNGKAVRTCTFFGQGHSLPNYISFCPCYFTTDDQI